MSKKGGKRKRLADNEAATDALAEAVTQKVINNLRKEGIFPAATGSDDAQIAGPSGSQHAVHSGSATHIQANNIVDSENNYTANTSSNISQLSEPVRSDQMISISATDLASRSANHVNACKPIGRPLYTKINLKLQEKIVAKEFIDMSDILTDHRPSENEFHFQLQNRRVGLASNKKRKYLTTESWTDAFSIFASVLRPANPDNLNLAEDLAIYMDLIRQIQKDG